MKAFFPGHDAIVGRFGSGMVTGYVATRIEIDADDVKAMALAAASDPAGFQATMAQLRMRFFSERIQSFAEIGTEMHRNIALIYLSPPQAAFMAALKDGPRHAVGAKCPTQIGKDGIISCVWSVWASLERRGLIRRRPDMKWELV